MAPQKMGSGNLGEGGTQDIKGSLVGGVSYTRDQSLWILLPWSLCKAPNMVWLHEKA